MQYHSSTRIPARLHTGEPGSFAAYTIATRLPGILARLEDHADTRTIQALRQLASEIREGSITPLPPIIPGTLEQYIEPIVGYHWTNVPFLTVELYFYARILLAFGYMATAPVDPFRSIKNTASSQAVESLAALTDHGHSNCAISGLLHRSMTGNTADLSQQVITDADQISLLVDESHAVGTLLDSGLHRVDFVFDNAGIDVLADLLLIREICKYCSQVVAHVRPWPMFISDVTLSDLEYLITELTTSSIPMARKLGEDIVHLQHSNRLILRISPALGLPVSFCEDQTLTHDTFSDAALVIFKGDLNYRYFAGDRRWPHTTEKHLFFNGFGRAAVALRTLKSEVLVGLSAETAARTGQFEPEWLINGRHGIIQVFTSRDLKR